MSSYLTWTEARDLALAGTPVRRDSWPTEGIDTPPTWLERRPSLWVLTDIRHAVMRVVDAVWFDSAEFYANDWTTDPPGTERDVCLLDPPRPAFVPPGLALTCEPGTTTITLHADIGASSPAGVFTISFFLEGVLVGTLEAAAPGRHSLTVAFDPADYAFARLRAWIDVRASLPLPSWTGHAEWERVAQQILIKAPWTRVRYFSAHDIIADANGLGRSDYENFNAPWDADVMGFWVALPWVIGEKDFLLEYQWLDLGGGFGRNKHGLAWWSEGVTGGGGIETNFLGCWDAAVGDQYFFLAGTLQAKTAVTAFASPLVPTWRAIRRTGSVWTLKDGPAYPADGSLGEANWTASGVSVSAFPGIAMAGTHRIKEMLWRLA